MLVFVLNYISHYTNCMSLLSGNDGLPRLDAGPVHGQWIAFQFTVSALPLLPSLEEGDECVRQWGRVLGGFSSGGESELTEFLRKFLGLRRMIGRILLMYYCPFTAGSWN